MVRNNIKCNEVIELNKQDISNHCHNNSNNFSGLCKFKNVNDEIEFLRIKLVASSNIHNEKTKQMELDRYRLQFKLNSSVTEISVLRKELEFYRKTNDDLNMRLKGKNTNQLGLQEEYFIIDFINGNKKIKLNLREFMKLEDNINTIYKVDGYKKTDLTDGKKVKIQVKRSNQCSNKSYNKPYGQVHKISIESLLNQIPGLKKIGNMLAGICKLEIRENGIYKMDKIVRLTEPNYSRKELKLLTDTLNKYQRDILNLVFLGRDINHQPNLFVVSKYIDQVRSSIVFHKVKDIVAEFMKEEFTIDGSSARVNLGSNMYFVRKGGDGGKDSGNYIQFKISPCYFNENNVLKFNC